MPRRIVAAVLALLALACASAGAGVSSGAGARESSAAGAHANVGEGASASPTATQPGGSPASARIAAATQPGGNSESARITAALSPNRLGAAARLNIDIAYGQAESELPPPIRHALLRLPAALGIDIPTLRSCSATHLRAHGAHGCPPQSMIGSGQAVTDALLGSQLLSEHVALSLFVGPLVNLEPTFEILAEARTPFHERVVIVGRVLPDDPPFGEDLSIALPPIQTLPLEPDASIVSLALSIGPRPGARSHQSNAVLVPSHCPPGGFPFAIESSFADGGSSRTLTAAPCPR